MDRVFEGQVALVTGGGKGIGLGIAKALSVRGARVAVTGRHASSLEHAVAKMGDGLAIEMDVRNEASVIRGIAQAMELAGRLDILVNNAGIGLLETPLSKTSSDAWRDVIDTNLTGVFFATRAAWPHLTESRGQVLNVASIAGKQGFVGATAYCASKFGLMGFTEVLKKEGSEIGVRVLAICPGAVDTDIWETEWASDDVRGRMMTSDQLGDLAAQMLAAPRNLELDSWVVLNAKSPWSS